MSADGVRDEPVLEYAWFIEHLLMSNQTARLLHELKNLRGQGWDVTALLAPDGSVIGLGMGECYPESCAQLSLLAEAQG